MRDSNAAGPVDTTASPYSTLQALPFAATQITAGFWAQRQQINQQRSLRHAHAMLERAGNLQNLRLAAGRAQGAYAGRNFSDETVYKWLEALAWELGRQPDAELQQLADQTIDLVAAAQQPDGYLNSYYTVAEPDQRWADLDHGHEMYCAGHMIQAAVAFQRAIGDGRLLAVARRMADHIDAIFGPGRRQGACGHPEIEMALVELYRCTREPRYLSLAQFLVDQRGQGRMRGYATYGPEYHQDHVPVREAQAAAGHAVRQVYLAAAMGDLAMETGEPALGAALQRIWQDIASSKQFVTGGIGARFDGEAFGDAYELPSDQCYCETCAAIGSLMWNWRMLLLTGAARYADMIERTLYNAVLSSPALDGQHFFYVNPLMVRDGHYARAAHVSDNSRIYSVRPEWHYVACCPSNTMRLLASLGHYLATYDQSGIQIQQYASADINAELPKRGQVALQMRSEYPWDGAIRITVVESTPQPWTLRLRIPAWCRSYRLSVDGAPVEPGEAANGYLALTRAWASGSTVALHLAIEPLLLAANPRVDAVRGALAIARGPLIYCLEQHDQPASAELLDLQIDPRAPLQVSWAPELLGGVVLVHASGYQTDPARWGAALYQPLEQAIEEPTSAQAIPLTAIPYYAWANRGPASMRVWIPRRAPT